MLAQQLAVILEPLFLANDSDELSVPAPSENHMISNEWICGLERVFLVALDLIVKLRQRSNDTFFLWPEVGTVFNGKHMQPENSGHEKDFEGKRVLLTLMPAALSYNTSYEEDSTEVYYKAPVLLEMDYCAETTS